MRYKWRKNVLFLLFCPCRRLPCIFCAYFFTRQFTTQFSLTVVQHYRFFATLLIVFSLLFLEGCGPRGPVVHFVEGTVTLDGQPVEEALVSFVPLVESDDLSGPLLAIGYTDADGKYTLTTTRGSTVDGGTSLGEYKVTIVKKDMLNLPTGPIPPGQRFVPNWHYHVPQAFEDSSKSSIDVEVVRGRNVFNFALKSDGTCEITKSK